MRNKRVRALVPKGSTKKERTVIKDYFKSGKPMKFREVRHPRVPPTYR